MLLFNATANVELPPRLNWQFLLSYYVVMLLVYGLGMWLSKRWFTAPAKEQSIFGMGSSYSNLVLVGLPIISNGLGEAALLPLFLIASIHSAVQFSVTSILVENGARNGRSTRQIMRQTSQKVIKNPIVIGLALGFTFNIFALPIPQAAAEALTIISDATLACSLIVLGGSLTAYKISGHLSEAGLIVGLKLALQPILVWVLVFHVFDIDPLWGAAAVMAAGMPVGISSFIFADNYQLGIAALSTAVLLSTILAVFSQSIWLFLLT